jgi:hypothetical protein
MKETNELIPGFRIQPLHLLSIRILTSGVFKGGGQVDDYSRILCLSLVCHQESDLCRSPRETLLSLSFLDNDANLLSLQEITP